MRQIEVSFICSIGIFSHRETLELLTVSLSFETFFPVWLLIISVLFVELLHLYLLVTILNVVDSLNHIFIFVLLGECQPLFNAWTPIHVLQFSSGTVLLNFVWLSHNALSLTINLLSFPFLSYITLILCGVPYLFASFLSGTVPLFFMWMSHKSPVCLLPYLCVNVTHARLHFLCVNVTRISLCFQYF